MSTEQPTEAVEDSAEASETDDPAEHAPENKDDTGVADPWGLPKTDAEPTGSAENGNSKRLLTKIGT